MPLAHLHEHESTWIFTNSPSGRRCLKKAIKPKLVASYDCLSTGSKETLMPETWGTISQYWHLPSTMRIKVQPSQAGNSMSLTTSWPMAISCKCKLTRLSLPGTSSAKANAWHLRLLRKLRSLIRSTILLLHRWATRWYRRTAKDIGCQVTHADRLSQRWIASLADTTWARPTSRSLLQTRSSETAVFQNSAPRTSSLTVLAASLASIGGAWFTEST